MTMREKVARAIFSKHWPPDQWDVVHSASREHFLSLADAALFTLETPDEGMVEAAKTAWELQPAWVENGPGSDGLRDDVVVVWQAMIRAARTGDAREGEKG